jgi:hypothetical protein
MELKYLIAIFALIIGIIIDFVLIKKNQAKFNDYKVLDFIKVRKFTKFDFSIIFYLQTMLIMLNKPLNSLYYEVDFLLILFVIGSFILMAGLISLIRFGIYRMIKSL